MAQLPTKPELLRRFERALEEGGGSLLYLSPKNFHPARYVVTPPSGERQRLLVYIWNLTHGGGERRPAGEYRIQITGTTALRSESDTKTVILGWSGGFEAFAGFDRGFHAGTLGASPSMQIAESALNSAQTRGFAPWRKGNGEIAIAFRPDFALPYVANLEALHATGAVPDEIDLVERLSVNPASVPESEIEVAIAIPRRRQIIATLRAIRDAQFRRRVLRAYGHRCAFCGLQLDLLDAAHVLPVDQPGSTDDTNNGVGLCVLHHRAFDRALVTFDQSYRVLVNEDRIAELAAVSRTAGLPAFRAALRPHLWLPADLRDHPHHHFVAAANQVRGWRV